MSLIARDLPALVFMLLPGFLAAGVFYTLTSHPKTSEFERLIQALIFTALLKVGTLALRALFLGLGHVIAIASWTTDVELVWSIFLSVPLGLIFAWLANTDRFHRWARARHLSSRTSFPSEWYGAFYQQKRWVVLHLSDGRRLYGWPVEWPDQPDKGHFVLDQPAWLLDSGDRASLNNVSWFLVPATDIKMVEFILDQSDVAQDSVNVAKVDRLLIEAQAKPDEENSDGSESPSASPESSPSE